MAVYYFPLPKPNHIGVELSPDASRVSVKLERAPGGDYKIRMVIDETLPTKLSMSTNADGTSIAITCSETLDTESVPATTDFAIAGTSATISAVAISGAVVTLTISGPIVCEESVTIAYTAPAANNIQDVYGNELASWTAAAVTNLTAPLFTDGACPADGASITLNFDVALDDDLDPAAAAFTINGDDATVASVDVTGGDCVLTLSGVIESGDTITVDYNKALAGAEPMASGTLGREVATATGWSITNNSTV
jgi:uncharacterized repeat protein (TIGR02059 family)